MAVLDQMHVVVTHSALVGMRSIVMGVYVCLSVCLHAYSKNHKSELL